MTFADKVFEFHAKLSAESIELPAGFEIVNPFSSNQQEKTNMFISAFYNKYYSDTFTRRIILGSSPSRKGSAAIGVPFENAKHLKEEFNGIFDGSHVSTRPVDFLDEVIEKCGGRMHFFKKFYMNFVCPLGIVKVNANGNSVNYNYYENKKLQDILTPFIIRSLRSQLELDIDTSVCYCIGCGQNFRYLNKLNSEHRFFDTIIPLEHPRFVVQYNPTRRPFFVDKYIEVLRNYPHYNTKY